MTWFNVQWKMDVDVANVTAAYSAVNLAGPKARAIIQSLATDIDFSKEAFRTWASARARCWYSGPHPPRGLRRRGWLRNPLPGRLRRSALGYAHGSG